MNIFNVLQWLGRRSLCSVKGHQNSGEYYQDLRVWQYCPRCDGWLGWMFGWETPWTREDAIKTLSAQESEAEPAP